jgi:hypothetical protein
MNPSETRGAPVNPEHTHTHDTPEAAQGPDQPQETGTGPEMCCDGQQTAEQHRHDSPDGKCCVD